ncbi:MAG: hypothetical protein JWO03_3276 [Bacteroidetes bacterium]|nr:hypothetical protein [Bacteroidota bacterium]
MSTPQQKALFISYDGMTDPLGRSQVIPYLSGLSASGIGITLMSFEKAERFEKNEGSVRQLLKEKNITWVPLSYTKKPPILSTLWDIRRMYRAASDIYQKEKFDIVHCRSYISALAGLYLKRKYGVRMIFDMRGFWADERLDGGIWPRDKQPYKSIYNFFKRKEKEFLQTADQTISLTANGKKEILSWNITEKPISITVIPCCADLEKFSTTAIDKELQTSLKDKLGIKDRDVVMSYLGSIGTWYMLDEMLDLFKTSLETHPALKFLFITADDPSMIYEKARQKAIPAEKIMVTESPYDKVATYLSLSQIAVFFIKPVYSKKASSPTKQGELMAMGIPLICNKGVGDVDMILEDTNAGIAIEGFSQKDYQYAASRINDLLAMDKEHIKQGAYKYYSLAEGVKRYKAVYDSLK